MNAAFLLNKALSQYKLRISFKFFILCFWGVLTINDQPKFECLLLIQFFERYRAHDSLLCNQGSCYALVHSWSSAYIGNTKFKTK